MALNLATIVQTALRLQNEEGLDGVTTRRVAQLLGVQGPALYRHVRSMPQLLGHMTAAVIAAALEGMVYDGSWEDWLRAYAQRYRSGLLRYRDSVRMLMQSEPSARTGDELVPMVYAPLVAAGIPERDALFAEGLIASFVLGWVAHEQNDHLRTAVESRLPMGQAFADGIDAIIIGLRPRLGPAGRT